MIIMARITVADLAARTSALEAGLVAQGEALTRIEALLTASAPAKVTRPRAAAKKTPAKAEPKAPKAPSDFTRAVAARKADNATIAGILRAGGVTPNGAPWAAAKEAFGAGKTERQILAAARKAA